ncbi:NAD(P)-dependent alcohol dehydrogenase [Sorangium sp. So ce834]|uniref:NAD(P)-dependent alcohol dehydrogenase n=1 Tax=Sorangium sp. So ce834 TaxID=3133321 RepID=UPI003F6373EB
MKAAICPSYGPPEVLFIGDVPKPTPKADEILVKVRASSVNSSDWFIRSGLPTAPFYMRWMMKVALGFRGPRRRILGLIVVGEVAEVGKAVTRFRAGDRIWAFTRLRFGAYAQFTCLRESSAAALSPRNLAYEEAAAIPYGGLLALHCLRRAALEPGHAIVIYGASGGVGTSAVQLARHMGAEVTAVCGAANAELVRSLGAAHVMDYTTETSPPEGARYHAVLDAVGKRKTSPLRSACEDALAPGGRSISVDDGTPEFVARDLEELGELVDNGFLRPVIDRRYPLDQIAEAHRYVEQDHKKGAVVITVAHDD